MEVALLLQFSIALFTGMVAATLVPPVRRVVPRPVEIAMWVVLAVVCVIGVLSITNPHAKELTGSVFWGMDQIITTLVGLLGAGVTASLVDNRFGIATALTLACGADVMALALLRSQRKSRGWQPIVRLYEWMELPRLVPVVEPVEVPYAIDELNRKWAAAMAVAGAAVLTWLVHFSIWARAWYVTAGKPALTGLARRVSAAVLSIGSGGGGATELAPGRLVDIHVLPRVRSIGWYGPRRPAASIHAEEEDEDESQQTGRLAS